MFNKYLWLFFFACGFFQNIPAQLKDYDWDKADFNVPEIFPDFMIEDAVILEQTDYFEILEDDFPLFKIEGNTAPYKLITFKRVKMKILTLNGLDKFANFEFNKKFNDRIVAFDGRVLKSDQTEFLVQASDVIEVNIRNPGYGFITDQSYDIKLKMAFPNVEVGDIIEYVYSFESTNFSPYNLSGEILLNTEIPILKSVFHIKVPRDMDITYILYNNFQKPEVSADQNSFLCSFKQENIPSLYNSDYSRLQSEQPCFYYQVLPKDITKFRMDWNFIYKLSHTIYFNETNINKAYSQYYKKWKTQLLKPFNDSAGTKKFLVLFEDIKKNLVVKNVLPDFTLTNHVGYFLKNGYINRLNLLRLYKKLFDELGMDYYLCFARTKTKDAINFENLRKDEATDIFFIFMDDKGKFRYVYPADEFQDFEIDELPNHLLGTEAVMMKHKVNNKQPFKMPVPELEKFMKIYFRLKYDYDIETKVLKLPAGTPNKNYIMQQNLLNVNMDDNSCSFHNQVKLSGAVSTKYRSFFSLMERNRDMYRYYSTVAEELFQNKQNDTSYIADYKTTYPYELKIVHKGKISDCIQKIDTNLYVISLKDMIFHDKLAVPDEKRVYGVSPEFVYSDFIQLIMKFEEPVELLNIDKVDGMIENDFGSYYLRARLVDPHTIFVNSHYSIKQDFLPSENFEKLMELNRLLNKSVLKKLIIKKV